MIRDVTCRKRKLSCVQHGESRLPRSRVNAEINWTSLTAKPPTNDKKRRLLTIILAIWNKLTFVLKFLTALVYLFYSSKFTFMYFLSFVFTYIRTFLVLYFFSLIFFPPPSFFNIVFLLSLLVYYGQLSKKKKKKE